ncbi:MAG: hypothetical protein IJ538_03440 [Clostridia bacterium]|nr:hypothetical protein [Clostridia bacterium]
MTKMKKIIYHVKENKMLLVATIIFLVAMAFCFGVIVFDLIELVSIQSNSASISSAFIPLNIVAGVVALASLIFVIITSVLSRKK